MVVNNADIEADITLVFDVRLVDGTLSEGAGARSFDVPAHSRVSYESNAIYRRGTRLPIFVPCSQVARFELVTVKGVQNLCLGRI
jgi:hypothetical protein